jgi:ATP-dependent Clp protease protease subunit
LLNSPGGDVIETLGLIDYMKSQEEQGIKFNIIVRGAAMSAAALLLTCATGVRAASKHSKIMVHQLSTIVVGKLSDVKSNAKFSEELEHECNQLMANNSKMDKAYWENISSSDYFMSAEKALELGIIDKII